MTVEAWREIDAEAHKDMVWLLVDYSDRDAAGHPLADATYAATIGFWDENEEEWKFAGWCWSHDHFTEGRGRVVAYKPIGFMLEHTGEWPLPEGGNLPADCVTPALSADGLGTQA
ncbi:MULTISPECIES: hypothetical protein [unclassified Sphingomonas]|uniref:hypothetical protein n=1 Tax=unclassified Sphingomonas TaxID=196159 RepID=UPI0006F69ADB|nr:MULTISPECIES: hypothetical protein [unclassified Sphingomonas]KQX19374.1 hypothetical protein ASD17_12595 [Sphingomonas sp. Root1294]KQY65577.1 hypothetical protein ASD39_15795 [Sphingomonas sp. Root50]KRB95122.1 hypothetical protein ASE22_04260 [Sphingomonas sp. Root720]